MIENQSNTYDKCRKSVLYRGAAAPKKDLER